MLVSPKRAASWVIVVKIAVTGASGFIGRHVVAELERRNLQATLVSRRKAEAARTDTPHRWIQLDISVPPDDAFSAMGAPDLIIHLAWGGLPNYRSLHHIESELPDQYRFLSRLVRCGLKRMVVVGTCFEYGMLSGPLSEDMPARPDNPYGFAKHALCRQLEFLKEKAPFALTWARLFYLFGKFQSRHSLFSQLESAVLAGEKTFRMSGGEQLRDYLPVTEAARLLVDLALAGAEHGIVNVCSGRPISVRSLVEGWLTDYGWKIEPEFGHFPYPDYEPMAFWGDRSKLDHCLRAGR